MTLLIAALCVAGFVAAFVATHVVARARDIIAVSRASGAALRDDSLDDDAKEAQMQAAAKALGGGFVGLLWRLALVLLAAWLPMGLADLFGIRDQDEVLAFLLRIDVIVISSGVVIALVWLGRRLWPR